MPADFAFPHAASASKIDRAEEARADDEMAVLAESCDGIGARGRHRRLVGLVFAVLALALRERPVNYEEISVQAMRCDFVRRRHEAEIGDEVNREARLILVALRHLLITKDIEAAKPLARANSSLRSLARQARLWLAKPLARANSSAERRSPSRETGPGAIAEIIEGPWLVLSYDHRRLVRQLEETISQISIQDNLLIKSLTDYSIELRPYRDWAMRKSF